MERKLEEIINEGKKNGKQLSEINAELKAAGANFHLDYKMCEDGPVTSWTEQEMAEGFAAPTEEAKPIQKKVDMSRRPEFAGTIQEQVVLSTTWKVAYDIDGYVTKATRA